MIGLHVDNGGFELLFGAGRVGPRRTLGWTDTVERITALLKQPDEEGDET